MSFTDNELVQAGIYAHELGHNAGLSHDDGEPSGQLYDVMMGC